METKYVRYITMNGLRAILNQSYDVNFGVVPSENVLRLKAEKSVTDCKEISNPLSWVRLKQADQFSFKVDYYSFIHGAFAKKQFYQLIDDWKLEDVPVQELALKIPKESGIGERFAKLSGNGTLADEDWVAVFEEYTLRQEDEKGDFIDTVKEAQALNGLSKIRFQAACLDLAYMLPCREWKEIAESHLTKIRRIQFEKWRTDFQQIDSSILKKVTDYVFPKKMCSGRHYVKTQKNVWSLMKGRED